MSEWVKVSQSCLSPCDPMDCSPPGSSVYGILQARIQEWVAIASSKGSSWPRDQTQVSCIVGRFFTLWAIRAAPRWSPRTLPNVMGNDYYFYFFRWHLTECLSARHCSRNWKIHWEQERHVYGVPEPTMWCLHHTETGLCWGLKQVTGRYRVHALHLGLDVGVREGARKMWYLKWDQV